MSSIDAEDLISRLSYGLDPRDRAAFRHAAETALATVGVAALIAPSPGCGVPTSIRRPTRVAPAVRVTTQRPASKLLNEAPLEGDRDRSRNLRVVRQRYGILGRNSV